MMEQNQRGTDAIFVSNTTQIFISIEQQNTTEPSLSVIIRGFLNSILSNKSQVTLRTDQTKALKFTTQTCLVTNSIYDSKLGVFVVCACLNKTF